MRSRIASAIVGSPTMSYQLEDGYCDVMMMDFRSCLSSMISSSMGRSFADVKQYGTLLGVERHDEQVVKDEQLASLNLLEFRLKCTFDFGDFQRSEQFRGIGIEGTESPFACFVAEGAGQIAFPRS